MEVEHCILYNTILDDTIINNTMICITLYVKYGGYAIGYKYDVYTI